MPPGAAGGRHLCRHVARIGQLLVVQMAAFLRQQLVLDVHRAGAGVLEAAYHVHHVQRLSVAGVAVHQHGQTGGAGDLADEKTNVVHRDHAQIRQAHGGAHRRTGKVERGEAGGARLQRRHAVVRAGDSQNPRLVQQPPEADAGGFGGQVVGDQVGHGGVSLSSPNQRR